MFEHKCKKTNHNFEPRYDIRKDEVKFHGYLDTELAEILIRGDYLYDICIHCGTRINKDGNNHHN